jgi:hypothetical protein
MTPLSDEEIAAARLAAEAERSFKDTLDDLEALEQRHLLWVRALLTLAVVQALIILVLAIALAA